MMDKCLTLAVPTFKRKKAIYENSLIVKESGVLDFVNYLVIDNASKDGTVEALDEMFLDKDNVEVIENSENIFFFGNFLKIIECAMQESISDISIV